MHAQQINRGLEGNACGSALLRRSLTVNVSRVLAKIGKVFVQIRACPCFGNTGAAGVCMTEVYTIDELTKLRAGFPQKNPEIRHDVKRRPSERVRQTAI